MGTLVPLFASSIKFPSYRIFHPAWAKIPSITDGCNNDEYIKALPVYRLSAAPLAADGQKTIVCGIRHDDLERQWNLQKGGFRANRPAKVQFPRYSISIVSQNQSGKFCFDVASLGKNWWTNRDEWAEQICYNFNKNECIDFARR